MTLWAGTFPSLSLPLGIKSALSGACPGYYVQEVDSERGWLKWNGGDDDDDDDYGAAVGKRA